MCRLRTNFARLGDPLQGLHIGNAPLSVAGATTSPSGGSTAAGGDRGAFPRAKRGCLVFAADRQQCRRRRHTNSSPRSGDTTALAATGCVKPKNPPADRPVNLKNLSPLTPLNPGRKGAQIYLYKPRYRRYNKDNAGKENTFSLCL